MVENHGHYRTFYPGRYCHAMLSGTHLVQWVANQRPEPEEIHLLGFEGYRSTALVRVPDSWNGDLGPEHGDSKTDTCGAFLNSMMNQMPRTRFYVYGDPAWDVTAAPNVFAVREP